MHFVFRSIAAAVVGLSVLAPAFTASAGCPAIPENKVWGKVSNPSVARYVARAYEGDWFAYIEQWEKRAEYARGLVQRNSILVFHQTDLWLRDDELAAYAGDIEKRIQVTRCLARGGTGNGVSGETLAGSALNGGS